MGNKQSGPKRQGLSLTKEFQSQLPLKNKKSKRKSYSETQLSVKDGVNSERLVRPFGVDFIKVRPPPRNGQKENGESRGREEEDNYSKKESDYKRTLMAESEYECTEIGEYLYVGGARVAQSWEILKEKGINRIINCSASVVDCAFADDVDLKYLVLNMVDGKQDDISWFMCEVINFIWTGHLLGEKTLLHCEKGISRSCSFAIAYGIWHAGCSFQQSFEYIKQRRRVCNPNSAFVCNLIEIDKFLNGDVRLQPLIFRCASHLLSHDSHTPVLKLLRDPMTRSIVTPSTSCLDPQGVYVIRTPEILKNASDGSPRNSPRTLPGIHSKNPSPSSLDNTNTTHTTTSTVLTDITNIINTTESVIYIWKGKEASIETAEIAHRLAGYMRGVISTAEKLISVNEGEEPEDFFTYCSKNGPYDSIKNPKLKFDDLFDLAKLIIPDENAHAFYPLPERTMRASRSADGSFYGDNHSNLNSPYQHSPLTVPLNDSTEHNRSSSKSRILPYDNSPSPKRGDNNLSRNGSLLSTMTNSLYPSRRNFLNSSTENSRIYSIHESNENGMSGLSIHTSGTNMLAGERGRSSGQSSPVSHYTGDRGSEMSVSPTKHHQTSSFNYFSTSNGDRHHSPSKQSSFNRILSSAVGGSNSNNNHNNNNTAYSTNNLNLNIPTMAHGVFHSSSVGNNSSSLPNSNSSRIQSNTNANANASIMTPRSPMGHGNNNNNNYGQTISLSSSFINHTSHSSAASSHSNSSSYSNSNSNISNPSPGGHNAGAPSPVSTTSFHSPGPPVTLQVPIGTGLREGFTLGLPPTINNKRTFVEAGKSFLKKSIESMKSPLRTSHSQDVHSANKIKNSNGGDSSPVGKKLNNNSSIKLNLNLPLNNLNNNTNTNNNTTNVNSVEDADTSGLTPLSRRVMGTGVNGTIVAPIQIDGEIRAGISALTINPKDSSDNIHSNSDISSVPSVSTTQDTDSVAGVVKHTLTLPSIDSYGIPQVLLNASTSTLSSNILSQQNSGNMNIVLSSQSTGHHLNMTSPSSDTDSNGTHSSSSNQPHINSTRTDGSAHPSQYPITSREQADMEMGTGRTNSGMSIDPYTMKSPKDGGGFNVPLAPHIEYIDREFSTSKSKLTHAPIAPLSMQKIPTRKPRDEGKIPEDISLIRGPTPLEDLIPVVTGELNSSRDFSGIDLNSSGSAGGHSAQNSPAQPTVHTGLPHYYSPRSGTGNLNSSRSRAGSTYTILSQSGSSTYRPLQHSTQSRTGQLHHSQQISNSSLSITSPKNHTNTNMLSSRGGVGIIGISSLSIAQQPTSPILNSFRKSSTTTTTQEKTVIGGTTTILHNNNNNLNHSQVSAYTMSINGGDDHAVNSLSKNDIINHGYIKPKLYEAVTSDGKKYKWECLGIYDDTDLDDNPESILLLSCTTATSNGSLINSPSYVWFGREATVPAFSTSNASQLYNANAISLPDEDLKLWASNVSQPLSDVDFTYMAGRHFKEGRIVIERAESLSKPFWSKFCEGF